MMGYRMLCWEIWKSLTSENHEFWVTTVLLQAHLPLALLAPVPACIGSVLDAWHE